MDQIEFVSHFASRPQSFAWFLGAGASRSAGVPTAADVLWDMKRRFYCREENQDIDRQDLQSVAVQSRIQSFMESRGFPNMGELGEYERYFQLIFGDDRERQRAYIHAILTQQTAKLSVGPRVLGALIALGHARAVFTTNFDDIVEQSVADVSGKAINTFHLEGSKDILSAWKDENFPIYCKLHGDFRYDSIKNLAQDLVQQNEHLAACFVQACNRFGLIIGGYSGRDKSVMDLFYRVLDSTTPYPHGIFWTGLKSSPPPPDVMKFLTVARSKGVDANFVPIETYDSFLLRLWRNLPNKPLAYDLKVRKASSQPVSIPLSAAGHGAPIVRMNALPLLSLPKQCFAVNTSRELAWTDIKDIVRRADRNIIATKADKILAWGKQEDIRAAIGTDYVSITPHDLPADLSRPDVLQIKAFIEKGLVAALVRGRPLVRYTDRRASFVIATHHDEELYLAPLSNVVGKPTGIIPGLIAPTDKFHPEPQRVTWAESARIAIEQKNNRWWLIVEPDVWIWPVRARRLAVDFLSKRREDRLNAQFSALLDAWIKVLLGSIDRNSSAAVFGFDGTASIGNPSFEIGSRSAFTRRHVA